MGDLDHGDQARVIVASLSLEEKVIPFRSTALLCVLTFYMYM
jgi:hypothetical protein